MGETHTLFNSVSAILSSSFSLQTMHPSMTDTGKIIVGCFHPSIPSSMLSCLPSFSGVNWIRHHCWVGPESIFLPPPPPFLLFFSLPSRAMELGKEKQNQYFAMLSLFPLPSSVPLFSTVVG